MKRSPYVATTGAVYLYFVLYGMAVIVMSQHSAQLQQQWGATEGQVLQAIAGVGIGKIIGPTFAGFLSDRFGRRPAVVTGLVLVAVFLGALLVSPTWQVGFVLAVLFGLANAIGDTGNYPTLMEIFPAHAGTANVLVKAAIALGQLTLPLLVTASASAGLPWGVPLTGMLLVLAGLVVTQLRAPYPDHRSAAAPAAPADAGWAGDAGAAPATAYQADQTSHADGPRPRAGVDGAALVAYAFCATAMFWLAQNTLPALGVHLAGMSPGAGRALVAEYSAGSIVGVLATAALVARAVRGVTILVVYPAAAALAYTGLLVLPDPGAFRVCAFAIGVFAAGGLFQLTVVVLAEFFPQRKGVVTSMVGLASGLAAFALPFVSGLVVGDASEAGSRYRVVVALGIGVAVAAALLGALVRRRHTLLRVAPVGAVAVGAHALDDEPALTPPR